MQTFKTFLEESTKLNFGKIPIFFVDKKIEPDTLTKFNLKNRKNDYTKILGSGSDATVFSHGHNEVYKLTLMVPNKPTYPNISEKQYNKIIIDKINSNGQTIFTKLVLEHQNNPFFPKIYSAKIYVEKKEISQGYVWIIMAVVMERLHSITSNNIKHLLLPFLQNLGLETTEIEQSWNDYDPEEEADDAEIFLQRREIMRSFFENKNLLGKSKNPYFNEAMKILHSVKTPMDLHHLNFMYRLTSAGPHLVIIDPFFIE